MKKKKMPTGGKVDPALPSLIKAPVKKDISSLAKKFIENFSNTPTSIPTVNATPSQKLYSLQSQADELFSSKPAVLYEKDDPISLTAGKMRGATPSKRLIKDIVNAADAEGLDRNTLLGLAAQESMFGSGYAAGRREVPTGSSAKSVVSGWNLDAPYRPTDLKQFLKSKGVPGIQVVKTKTGYLYANAPNVSDDQLNHSIDSMAQVHPELIDQYAQANSNVIPSSDVNYFREAAKFIKTQGLSKYNPGDPDYPNKIANTANLVRQDPNLQNYIRSFAKGGSLNFSSKANYKKWLAYGHIHGNFESTPGNQKISINGNKHKVHHAAFGDTLQPIQYYPNNNGIKDPLQSGLQNIKNYFSNQPTNIVANNATAQGPSFYENEYALNSDTGEVSQTDYTPLESSNSMSPSSNKFRMPNIHLNTAGPIMAIAGLINATADQDRINKEYSRQARKNSMVEGYNTNPYGNGSQAIYAKGGQISYRKGSTYNLSNAQIESLKRQGYELEFLK